MRGIVFDIQRFSIHDGSGIRTTVFLKGCPLRCRWCHNPEAFRLLPQASPVSGKIYGYDITAGQVIDEVMRDVDYYRDSGGGVTFSGGEPTMQYDFLHELLKLSKQNSLHTCVETCGHTDTEELLSLSEMVDMFLFDFKLAGPKEHEMYTGKPNDLILSNLAAIHDAGRNIILRCPIIPGVNDNESHFMSIRGLLAKYPMIQSVEAMPFHNIGKAKWEDLALSYDFADAPDADEIKCNQWKISIAKQFKKVGLS